MEKEKIYYTVNDFMKDAEPSTVFKEVQEETIRIANSPEYMLKENKRLADIASLMNKVVGAEGED